MPVYLVTWDLNKEKPNYSQARAQFIARLDQYENKRDTGLDSVRFVSTNWTADQVSNDLQNHLDSNDRLIVTKLATGSHQGWLSKETWDWMNKRL